MYNFFTWLLIIFLIVLIGVICLLTGIHLGKNVMGQDKIENAQAEAIQLFAEKVKNLPVLNKITTQPENLMFGTITAINGQTIKVKVEPQSIDDILNEVPTEFSIKVSPNTKIYYIKINEQMALNNPENITDIISQVELTLNDLNINELISIIIDPVNKNKPIIEAKEIKVNR